MADCLERYPAFKNVMLSCLESNSEPAQRILSLETFALICRVQRKKIETMGKTWFQEKVINSLKVRPSTKLSLFRNRISTNSFPLVTQQLIRRGQTTNEKVVGWNILRDFVTADRTDPESDMIEERLIEKTLRRIDPNPLIFFLDSLKNQVLEVRFRFAQSAIYV